MRSASINMQRTLTQTLTTLGCALAIGAFSGGVQAGATFDSVKQKGFVQCGVTTGLTGISMPNSRGVWEGIDIDMCRAVAAAMFNDAGKFKVTPVSAQQRFVALQSGEVDVLLHTVTKTLTRDATMGLIGTGVNYYDSQGLLVPRSLGATQGTDIDGATICLEQGTTTEFTLVDWLRTHNIKFKPVLMERYDEMVRAFAAGRCDVLTADKLQLAVVRASMLERPDDYVILPEDLTKEPLGPVVRQGDEQWFNIVRWTLYAMLEAEEYGITSKNVDDMVKSSNPNVQRILGVTPGMGKNLGVDDKWAYSIVKQVGNYGESFEANLGMASPIKLARGINAQWRDGGLMYGWPIR